MSVLHVLLPFTIVLIGVLSFPMSAINRILLFWLVGTGFALTVAGEKMPWLTVHIALPLAVLLERMSAGPARALGLPVPRIAVGEPANLVLLDLDAEWTVRENGFRSRSANSWLLGETLVGAVVKTVADGRVVFGE